MALVANTPPVRVLLLDDDPAGASLLRQLLELLPGYRCVVSIHQPVFTLTPPDAGEFDLCFVSLDYAPGKLLDVVELLRNNDEPPHVFCIVNDEARLADRRETVHAIRAGIEDFFVRDDISPRILRALLESLSPTISLLDAPSTALPAEPPAENLMQGIDQSGRWLMDLEKRTASFDDVTLRILGQNPAAIGTSVSDWKALIHPDDVDRLVAELNSVLEGQAPPHPVSYRLRTASGEWYAVVSDAINVELDDESRPARISGTFYAAEAEEDSAGQTETATSPVEDDNENDYFSASPLAKAVFREVIPGKPFVVARINHAAALLEGVDPEDISALNASNLGPSFNDFDLDTVLARVKETGISESHRVMAVNESTPAVWRRYQFCRLNDDGVLAEFEDISDEVRLQEHQKSESILWEQIVRSLPELALLLDEDGTVVQPISGNPSDIGLENDGVAGKTPIELFGVQAGTQCLQQLARTLNTGKMTQFNIDVGSIDTGVCLECSLSPLHSPPGTQRRLILSLHDASDRRQLATVLGAERDQFREALQRVPAILYLKDVDGRYLLINPHFEAAYGIEEEMIVGKTDFEVFPDELAAELYETDHKVIESVEPYDHVHTIGQGDARKYYRSFNFPVCDNDGELTSICGMSIPLERLGLTGNSEWDSDLADAGDEIRNAASSVVGRVEKVLTESRDYEDILAQIQQLVETTTRARELILGVREQEASPANNNVFAADVLVQEVLELERILLPASATLKPLIHKNLSVKCDPLAFQQVMLRAIRHARSQLGAGGTMQVQLQRVSVSPRGCASCNEPFEGEYIELLVEESDSRVSDEQLLRLFRTEPGSENADREASNLGEIHRLVHQQGGHLLVQRAMPSGTSLHLLFQAASSDSSGNGTNNPQNTKVAHFPSGKH